MALGGAAKKLQTLVDTAEELYQKITELRTEVNQVRETVTETRETVDRLERDLEGQRAVLEALAREQGIDVDELLAEAAIEEAEPDGTGEPTDVPVAEAEGSDTTDAGDDA